MLFKYIFFIKRWK